MFRGMCPISFCKRSKMLKNIVQKFVSGKKNKQDKKTGAEAASNLKQTAGKFSNFIDQKLELIQKEFFIIKEKCQDLRETNFNLGVKHLENGKLPEAIFRFRLIKKIWPDFYDAYYELAYCLVLHEKPHKAKKILEELLQRKPDYDPVAQNLLNHLNQFDDAKNKAA